MDFPKGAWTPMLIGHQWPSSGSIATTTGAMTNRANNATAAESHADQLGSIRTGALESQEGVTADDLRQAFLRGEERSRQVAEKNNTKARSYAATNQSATALREQLTTIAAEGNTKIDEINASDDPLPTKIGKIVQVVVDSQTKANTKGAEYCGNVFDSIQNILTAEGDPRNARQFAESFGVNLAGGFGTPNEQAITQQVKAKLESASASSTANSAPDTSVSFLRTGGGETPASIRPVTGTPANPDLVSVGTGDQNMAPTGVIAGPAQSLAAASVPTGSQVNQFQPNNPGSGTSGASALGGLPTTAPGATTTPSTSTLSTTASSTLPTTSTSTPSFSAPSTPQALTPEGLAQSFSNGIQSGGPVSAGTEALSHNAFQAASQHVQQPDFSSPAPMTPITTPSAGQQFAFDTPHAPVADTAPAHVPSAETPSTMYAAPVASAAPVAPMPAASAPPVGPLPTYGSDLRPPTMTPPAMPPPGPAAGMAASAPVNPASATAAANQPAVVRQVPAAPAAAAPTAGLTENAVAAATVGATAGVASAQSAARARLIALVEAVARQEPKLRWAIGDLDDGTTILATDLASGWIPPHIEIPTGVRLLPPEPRRAQLESLLGDTTDRASWTPGHYLSPEKDVDPVSMSLRARRLPEVDDLNWELTQAANWRDGLPRLAHTLAKAGIAGTGVLDSEVELLREHLTVIRTRVLDSYPNDVDTGAVGNWQLLAAIEALVTGRMTELNYHFAWFQALTMTKSGGAQ